VGIQVVDLPVDQFIPLGKMLYKAPSDGKWGEHERKYLSFVPVLMQFGSVACYPFRISKQQSFAVPAWPAQVRFPFVFVSFLFCLFIFSAI
jgi:hypothetical protein